MANWIIPCNPNLYDVFGAFRSLKTVDWRQMVKAIEPGDTVYIYTGKPVQAITHKCRVVEVDIPHALADTADQGFEPVEPGDPHALQPVEWYMRLKLIKEYKPDMLTFAKLIEHGLTGRIMGQRRTGPYIQAAIDEVDK